MEIRSFTNLTNFCSTVSVALSDGRVFTMYMVLPILVLVVSKIVCIIFPSEKAEAVPRNRP
jgi:hypothetical protein